MIHRLLVGLVAGAVLVTLQAAPAAAVRTPDVPALRAVAKVYPHVSGGDRLLTEEPVEIYARRCDADPAVVRKAAGNQGDYYAPEYTPQTRRTPGITLRAARFGGLKRAKLYAARVDSTFRKCFRAEGQTSNVRFDVDLGDAGWGRTIRLDEGGATVDAQVLVVRKRTLVILALTVSTNGTMPARSKAVRLAGLALRTAG